MGDGKIIIQIREGIMPFVSTMEYGGLRRGKI